MVYVLSSRVSGSRAMPCVPALADGPPGGSGSCVCVAEVVVALFRCGPASPSYCLTLRWFRSRVGRLGVGPQLGRAAVVHAEGCFRIMFDSAGSAGVVSSPTLVVGHGVALFHYFVVLCIPAAMAGKGLVIPTEPCSRGSSPYSLQVGTRCRRSSLPDGRGGDIDRLVRRELLLILEIVIFTYDE
ncbi:hypothetical protein Taro_031623 [Colocasia esculenta]|uniref:Uncharacterized protein n=1 Tax=Colocasia esculenta TaxID=4460 RepID=A0A843VX54_COLES|nr:hypothetical protein [Colocasia esculenta]